MAVTQAFDFLVQWHLTERCNLRCRHCYQSGEKTAEMSRAQIFQVVEEVVRLVQDWEAAYDLEFAPSFNVTGGEPFLRADFLEILEKMTATGFEVFVLSNGTLVNADRARGLARAGVKGVQVSLEGPEQVHDAIRGQGSFAAAVAGLRTLMAAEVPVSVNVTLSRVNATYFLDLVEVAKSLGVPRLGFSRLVPSGRGAGLLDQALSIAEVQKLYELAFSLRVEGLKIVSGDPVATQMAVPPPAEDGGDVALGGCAAGVSGLTLLPDGTVNPCRRLPIAIGNVIQESLREIWAASPVLEALRDRAKYRGKCGACRRWAQCRGCRAIAYAHSQTRAVPDFTADDLQCFLEPE